MSAIIQNPSLDTKVDISAIQGLRTSAGPGVRTEIFFWGCSRGCPGCINEWTLTQPFNILTVREIMMEVFRLTSPTYDPPLVSIGGGEPWQQREALSSLCYWLKQWMGTWGNLLVYTGFEFDVVRDQMLMDDVDYVVTGPYIESLAYKKVEKSFVGSRNQFVWKLTNGPIRMLKLNEFGYLQEGE